MVKRIIFQNIQYRSGATRLGIHTADHDLGNPGLYDSAWAHLTRLQCHIQGTVLQPPVPDFPAGLVNGGYFRMRKCIFVGIAAIVASSYYFSFMDNNAADGDFS